MIVQKFLKKHSFKETDLINFHHELLEVAQKCLGDSENFYIYATIVIKREFQICIS